MAISVPVVTTTSVPVPPISVLVVVSMLAFVRAVPVFAPVSIPVTVAVAMLRIATIFIFVSTLCISGTRSVRVLAVW
jgi:hypothetical protein